MSDGLDIRTVSSEDEFVDAITDTPAKVSADAASELWDVWTFRVENGSDDVLVAVKEWFSRDEFGARRPVFFAQVEFDSPEKDAVLYDDIRLVDISVLENQIWDKVTITETLDTLDVTDDPDAYVDEKGMDWIPRSLTVDVFERE